MTITLNGIDLTEKMYWADQYTWSPVGQSAQYASDGSRYIVENQRGSRPITLEMIPGCYLPTSIITALKALADDASTTYTLAVDSTNYTVRFWRGDGPPLETALAEPANPASYGYHSATLRLIETP